MIQPVSNKMVGGVLHEVALLLELKGENPFKIKAYANAARSIETLEEPLETLLREERLKEIKGIGDALAKQITELISTGKSTAHEELKASIPPGLLEMLRIPGLGPKKIRALSESLETHTIGELEYACLENRLITIQGFGQKTQEKILQGIRQIKRYQGQHRYGEIIDVALDFLRRLATQTKVHRIDLAGSLRRKMEVVRNINLLLSTPSPREVLKAFSKYPEVEVAQVSHVTSGQYTLHSGIVVDLQIVPDSVFAAAHIRHTGSLSHWNALCQRAALSGFELKADGLFKDGKGAPCKDEEDVYRALGLEFIPPELREGQGEIEAAEARRLPRLIENKDLRGIFHVHTSFSDGAQSIRAMAEAAKKMGFSYLGLSDHSPTARYAGGLSRDRLEQQWEEIERTRHEMEGCFLLKGTESDILPDGSLDYDESILRRFDFVIASVHSHFHMNREEMTRRIIRAIQNPHTTILGHPTGRLLLAREPYPIDMVRIIDEAARAGVAIELNSHPYRLDIDWRFCKYAREKGCKIVINPDAHEEEGLKDTFFGVGIARKGWLEAGDILNTMDLEEIQAFLKKRTESRGLRTE